MSDEDERAIKIIEYLSGCPEGTSAKDMVHAIVWDHSDDGMTMEKAYNLTNEINSMEG